MRGKKINLEKVKESLHTTCPTCGYQIPPSEILRTDSTHMRCPKCKYDFVPRPVN